MKDRRPGLVVHLQGPIVSALDAGIGGRGLGDIPRMHVGKCLGYSEVNVPDETLGDTGGAGEVVFQQVLKVAQTTVFVYQDGLTWCARVPEHLDNVGMGRR